MFSHFKSVSFCALVIFTVTSFMFYIYQYASCASRKLALLIGESLKYIIVFTDIICNLLCPEAADELQAYW